MLTGGPFGRTESEENLPPQKTLIYLADRLSGKKIEVVPLRKGGQSCKCRKNRNKRKKIRHACDSKVSSGPSLRQSDEYIPEYKLVDSPYEKTFEKDRKEPNNPSTNGNFYQNLLLCSTKLILIS